MDFTLIGLTLVVPELPEDPQNQVIEFLVDAMTAMTDLGRFDLAQDAWGLALTRLPRAQPYWEDRIYLGASRFYALAGDHQLARNALARIKSPEHRKTQETRGTFFLAAGEIYTELGDLLRAEGMFHNCLEAVTWLIRQPDVEARCRWRLALLLADMGDMEQSSKEITKTLEALIASKDSLLWHEVEADLQYRRVTGGQTYARGVLEYVEPFRPALERTPDTVRTLTFHATYQVMELLAKRQLQAGEVDLAPLRETLSKLFTEPYLSARELKTLLRVARMLVDVGEDKLAISVLEELITRVEYARGLLTDTMTRQAFGGTINVLFEDLTNIYFNQASPDGLFKALLATESNRARALRALSSSKKATGHGNLPEGNIYEVARARLERILREPDLLGSEEAPRLAIDFLLRKIRPDKEGRGLGDLSVRPTSVPQRREAPPLALASLQMNLDPSVAVLVYYLTDKIAGAWVISNENHRWRNIGPIDRIEKAVIRLRTEVLSPEENREEQLIGSSRKAYELLLKPFADDIGEKTELVIIPDKILFNFPFEALVISEGPDSGKYLIERYKVSYQLSLDLLSNSIIPGLPRNGKQQKILLMGNPDLPEESSAYAGTKRGELKYLKYVAKEISSIAAVVGVQKTVTYMGADATKEKLEHNLGEFSILHFATHAQANARNPYGSFIKLAGPKGYLTLREVPKLNVSADLVVLSGCETGTGRILGGEGIWSFTSQFLAAGAKNVVASLWRVEDQSTAELMKEFYKAMKPEFERFGESLRIAKLRLLKGKEWQHPCYWAPFVLYGGVQ